MFSEMTDDAGMEMAEAFDLVAEVRQSAQQICALCGGVHLSFGTFIKTSIPVDVIFNCDRFAEPDGDDPGQSTDDELLDTVRNIAVPPIYVREWLSHCSSGANGVIS